MSSPLNANAIRAWQDAKGALGASSGREVKAFQYVYFILNLWKILNLT